MLHCCTASSEMAQMADRWATKIVALPIFSDAFSKAVLESPFANLAFVLAMEVRSAQVCSEGQCGPRNCMQRSGTICCSRLSC